MCVCKRKKRQYNVSTYHDALWALHYMSACKWAYVTRPGGSLRIHLSFGLSGSTIYPCSLQLQTPYQTAFGGVFWSLNTFSEGIWSIRGSVFVHWTWTFACWVRSPSPVSRLVVQLQVHTNKGANSHIPIVRGALVYSWFITPLNYVLEYVNHKYPKVLYLDQVD